MVLALLFTAVERLFDRSGSRQEVPGLKAETLGKTVIYTSILPAQKSNEQKEFGTASGEKQATLLHRPLLSSNITCLRSHPSICDLRIRDFAILAPGPIGKVQAVEPICVRAVSGTRSNPSAALITWILASNATIGRSRACCPAPGHELLSLRERLDLQNDELTSLNSVAANLEESLASALRKRDAEQDAAIAARTEAAQQFSAYEACAKQNIRHD